AALAERDDLVKGVVLTSTRTAFCVAQPTTANELDLAARALAPAVGLLARIQSPTLAMIEGDAVGPAWELALACDLRVACADVHLGSPDVHFGRLPACGGTQRLTRLAGIGVALRLLLLGELHSAESALALGLVHRVAEPEQMAMVVDEVL